MLKVTVNGHDHELSPDSPRATSHSALLQDIVASVNALETGTSPDGIELSSADATKNVISSASSNDTTTASVAALTLKNTVAHTSGDLEFDFQKSTGASLLGISESTTATTLKLSSPLANVITSASTDANTSASVAAMTFKNTESHTSSDLEFDFVNSAGNSLLTINGQGLTTVGQDTGGNFIVTGLGSGTYIQTTNSPAKINCYGATGVTSSVASLTVQAMTAQDLNDLIFDVQNSAGTSLMKVDAEGDTTITGATLTSSSTSPFVFHTSGTAGNIGSSGSSAFTIKNDVALDPGDVVFEVLDYNNVSKLRIDNSGTLYGSYVAVGTVYANTIDSGAAGVQLSSVAGTGGSATGVTAVKVAQLNTVVHKVTVTQAALTAAATSEAITLWTVPAKTRIVRVVADVTAAFTGGGTTAGTVEVGIASGDTDAYLTSFDIFTAPVTKGLIYGDKGVALTVAGGEAGAYPSWSGTGVISALFGSTTANVVAFTTGSVTFYIECSTYL